MRSFRQFLEADYCQGVSYNVDYWWDQDKDVSFMTMAGKDTLIQALANAAVAGGMKVFDKRLTSYGSDPNFGFSYLVVLGQSHIMLHTWPEKYMMNIDIFTCGSEGNPQSILQYIQKMFKPDHVQTNQATRGVRKDIENVNEKPDSPKDLKPAREWFLESEQKMEEDDLKDLLSKLPKKFRELVKGYKFKTQSGNTLSHDSEHVGENDMEKKRITIAAGWSYSRSFALTHEIGHLVFSKFVEPYPEKLKEWKSIVKRTKNKMRQNAEEAFCHCFSNLYMKHKIVDVNHPEWEKFIKGLC